MFQPHRQGAEGGRQATAVGQLPEDHRKQLSDVRRSGSSQPPFIFVDAADEEPQDHDYHTQQTNGRGVCEHAGAEWWIEKCQPA